MFSFCKIKSVFGMCSAAILLVLSMGMFFSCASAEERLEPPKYSYEYRLDDIERLSREDPVKAIHLINVYEQIYGESSPYKQENDGNAPERLAAAYDVSLKNLKNSQNVAFLEKRWDDAASFARSMSALGMNNDENGSEADFLLLKAKDELEKENNLSAFISAVASHAEKPLNAADAMLFLSRAVDVKQRRTAAFFLEIAQRNGAEIPAELQSYAEGEDPPSEMIKGVATVLVDRGMKVQYGRGTIDRVIGSAFFIDLSGLLITNYHVIASEVDPEYEGYSRMYIRLGDSSSARIPAKVIGYDAAMDLALIKAEYTPEYVFSVVDRVIPRIGETVLAIGSPGGLEKTVTSGIVSALGRRLLQVGDVIQIDAAVNHGNSGGPVVDEEGRLVGIVFAGITQFPGLNFAVPAERLAAALPAMINGGKAARPWLGFVISETRSGGEIVYVAPGTPAFELGIKTDTVITSINGQNVNAPQGMLIPAFQDVIFANRPGELVSVENTDGESFIMMSEARPEIPLLEAIESDSKERIAAPLFGLVLASSSGGNIFSRAQSFLVRKVIRGSIADEAGLSENDPVMINRFQFYEEEKVVLLDISVKKRKMGYMEASLQLPAYIDTPDTL
ncbi:MAG: S1C family serine protease [Treponema sp.]|jgi:S1-C subfamily serine protease|nr:S1C family serine protease [Treponema sp.]